MVFVPQLSCEGATGAGGAGGGFGIQTSIGVRIEEYFYISIAALDDVLSDRSLQAHPCKTSDSSYCLNERRSDVKRVLLGSGHAFDCAVS